MGGKNRHSQDRLFITATEWKSIGGKRTATKHDYRPLPFDHCAMSLSAYETPCCTANEGVIFDVTNLVPYVMKHKKNPITGEKMATSDIIRLNMSKNAEGLWHCPVTCKVFNNNTHIVAIKNTGNVFTYDAVNELNFKAKNYTDLLSGEKFVRSDVITLQDHMDPVHMERRDIGSFVHLQQIRDDNKIARQSDSKVRQNNVMGDVMKEIELKKATDVVDLEKIARLQTSSTTSRDEMEADDVRDLLSLKPTTEDVNPGRQLTTGQASSSLTSSSSECWTGNIIRTATVEELRDARWKKMKQVDKDPNNFYNCVASLFITLAI
jgi:peptidyl-prolyl cis-trans isomerase-like 2